MGVPGPGSYELKATEIKNGHYFLSTFKYSIFYGRNNTSPRYHPDSSIK
jgi:hypothetical protein